MSIGLGWQDCHYWHETAPNYTGGFLEIVCEWLKTEWAITSVTRNQEMSKLSICNINMCQFSGQTDEVIKFRTSMQLRRSISWRYFGSTLSVKYNARYIAICVFVPYISQRCTDDRQIETSAAQSVSYNALVFGMSQIYLTHSWHHAFYLGMMVHSLLVLGTNTPMMNEWRR